MQKAAAKFHDNFTLIKSTAFKLSNVICLIDLLIKKLDQFKQLSFFLHTTVCALFLLFLLFLLFIVYYLFIALKIKIYNFIVLICRVRCHCVAYIVLYRCIELILNINLGLR